MAAVPVVGLNRPPNPVLRISLPEHPKSSFSNACMRYVDCIVTNPPFGGMEKDGIKTNLLFFTKGQPTKEVWYYKHTYPKGAKRYNKGKPIRIEAFKPEKAWWGQPDKNGRYSKRKETEHACRVGIEDIKAGNYNLDLKNPHDAYTRPGKVEDLLPEYEKLLAQIAETRGKLKTQLLEALSR